MSVYFLCRMAERQTGGTSCQASGALRTACMITAVSAWVRIVFVSPERKSIPIGRVTNGPVKGRQCATSPFFAVSAVAGKGATQIP